MRRLGRLGSVQPNLLPQVPRGAVPSGPAQFPPHMIRQTIMGAPVPKQIIPPYWDDRTANSFAPPTSAAFVSPNGMMPGGASSVGPTGVPQQIGRSAAAQKVALAIQARNQANIAAAQAAQVHQQAAQAVQIAQNIAAAVDGSSPAQDQQSARAAVAHANTMLQAAQTYTRTAQLHDTVASQSEEAAQQAVDTTTTGVYLNPYTGQIGGDQMTDGGGGWSSDLPSVVDQPPEAMPSGGLTSAPGVSPLGVVAAAGAGFVFGGPIAAAIGGGLFWAWSKYRGD